MDSLCTACQLGKGKSSRLSRFNGLHCSTSTSVLKLIFSDVQGFALIFSYNGHNSYFLLFVDNYSKFMCHFS